MDALDRGETMARVIETHGLEKTYSDRGVPVRAVRGVDLVVESGDFAAIVGPSGSGKTTLLNMLGGLDRPTAGTVTADGQDIWNMGSGALVEFRLRHIGFVFQAYNLIPVLTARENVEFIMLLERRNASERTRRATELLASVGLAELADRRPYELSGGEQQRVAVARALASEPSFVLADEPTANLDSKSAGALLDIMETLNRDRGMTFLFSTHDPRVMERARRVITLTDGTITADGDYYGEAE
jgi:putative ABC transport system ATP-binding protein